MTCTVWAAAPTVALLTSLYGAFDQPSPNVYAVPKRTQDAFALLYCVTQPSARDEHTGTSQQPL